MINMVRSLVVLSLLTIACGDDQSAVDKFFDDVVQESLVLENSLHYAFACVDYGGDWLATEFTVGAIMSKIDIEPSLRGSWESDSRGVNLGGNGSQQSVMIYKPEGTPTNAEKFDQQEIEVDGVSLTCFLPQTEP